MKKVVIGMLASGLAALFFVGATPACSSSACSYKASPCSGDPVPTDEQISAAEKACEDAKSTATKCVSEGETYLTCYNDKRVCTDNKTDALKTLEACKTEAEAVAKCNAGG